MMHFLARVPSRNMVALLRAVCMADVTWVRSLNANSFSTRFSVRIWQVARHKWDKSVERERGLQLQRLCTWKRFTCN